LDDVFCQAMDKDSQRLDAIDDELEVGFDQTFERKWRRLELASHAIMALFVLAALLGLFGRGPLSHRTHMSANGRLSLDYEPLVRWGTSTQVTVHLSTPDVRPAADEGAFQKIWVSVNNAVVEPLGLQQVIPQPDATKAIDGGTMYEFAVPPGQDDALVRFVLKPSAVGLVHADVGDDSGANSLSWSQLVLP
jgi:hypothetical protein